MREDPGPFGSGKQRQMFETDYDSEKKKRNENSIDQGGEASQGERITLIMSY